MRCGAILPQREKERLEAIKKLMDCNVIPVEVEAMSALKIQGRIRNRTKKVDTSLAQEWCKRDARVMQE
jgi:hypothetical protein